MVAVAYGPAAATATVVLMPVPDGAFDYRPYDIRAAPKRCGSEVYNPSEDSQKPQVRRPGVTTASVIMTIVAVHFSLSAAYGA